MTTPQLTRAPWYPAADNAWHAEPAVIRRIVAEIDGVSTYELALRDERRAEAYRFAPGQYNMLYLPGIGEAAISISSDPRHPDRIAHTVRRAGKVTGALAGLRLGDVCGLRGPLGTSWPVESSVGRDLILVAGGIGLAPLRPAIHALIHARRQYERIHLLYGSRSPDTLLFAREYSVWSAAGIRIHRTVDRATPSWKGHVGMVTLLLERLRFWNPQQATLYCCGPEVMMRYVADAAVQRGMDPSHVWLAMERNFQCGAGQCGHCQLGPFFLCCDGPVMRYDRVERFLDVQDM